MTKTVTIRDVARAAGVSIATASRVLNGSERLTESTRTRVRQVMDELQFTPSTSARRLSLGRTMTITRRRDLVPDPAAGGRATSRCRCRPERQRIRPGHLQRGDRREARSVHAKPAAGPTDRRHAPVISLPPRPEDVARLAAAAVPVVVVDVHHPCSRGLPRVMGDDIAGGELAARHLLELGHREIGYIGDEFENPFGFTSSRDRYTGYEKALASAGLASQARMDGPRRPRPLRGSGTGLPPAFRTRPTHRHLRGQRHAGSGRASPPHTKWGSTYPATFPSSDTTTSRPPNTSG